MLMVWWSVVGVVGCSSRICIPLLVGCNFRICRSLLTRPLVVRDRVSKVCALGVWARGECSLYICRSLLMRLPVAGGKVSRVCSLGVWGCPEVIFVLLSRAWSLGCVVLC